MPNSCEGYLTNPYSILGPLLPLLSHPLQRRPRPNHEHRSKARPRLRTALDAQANLHRPGALLRLLRAFRRTFQPRHDAAQSSRMDE